MATIKLSNNIHSVTLKQNMHRQLCFQAIGDVHRRLADAQGLRAAVPRAGRLHKRVPMVRRDIPLSVRLRRSPDALLNSPKTAALASRPRSPGDRHDPRCDLLRDLAYLQATGEPLDISAQVEKHLLGDGHH